MTMGSSLCAGRYRSILVSFSPILLIVILVMFLPPEGKEGAQWVQFIGRFHPLIVHFPIALILLVPVLEVVGRFERFSYLRLSSGFVLVLSWTGYRGGQISQGEEHLTEYMPSPLRHAIGLPDYKPLAQATADSFYAVRVQAIFTQRCVTCHGPKKQKSGLRLDSYGWL